MIDIENAIFTRLADAIHDVYPDAAVIGDYVESIAKFPCVTVNEIENATVRRMQDPEPVEHYATVTYEVNVYCNERLDKKSLCKKILDICDGVMLGLKFRRRPARRVPNVDRTIYRMYVKYTAIVDEGTDDGNGTITYHIYRT